MTNLLPTSNPLTGAIGSLETGLENELTSGLESAVTSMTNNAIAQLGLQQYYSFYVKTVCEGNFLPNAQVKGAQRNTSVCEATTKASEYSPFATKEAIG